MSEIHIQGDNIHIGGLSQSNDGQGKNVISITGSGNVVSENVQQGSGITEVHVSGTENFWNGVPIPAGDYVLRPNSSLEDERRRELCTRKEFFDVGVHDMVVETTFASVSIEVSNETAIVVSAAKTNLNDCYCENGTLHIKTQKDTNDTIKVKIPVSMIQNFRFVRVNARGDIMMNGMAEQVYLKSQMGKINGTIIKGAKIVRLEARNHVAADVSMASEVNVECQMGGTNLQIKNTSVISVEAREDVNVNIASQEECSANLTSTMGNIVVKLNNCKVIPTFVTSAHRGTVTIKAPKA